MNVKRIEPGKHDGTFKAVRQLCLVLVLSLPACAIKPPPLARKSSSKPARWRR